jgi:4-aminobutyrate aminotransferase-like enzyme/Ser/Thr protein kinase RdoA (MazF antagonist)
MSVQDNETLAKDLLAAEYGLAGILTRLPGENLNYLVTVGTSERYVLKIAPPERDAAIIDMEYRAVCHAGERSSGLRLPGTVLTRSGEAAAEWGSNEALVRAQLLGFVTGTPWCDLEMHDDHLLADLGRKLAALDQTFSDFSHGAMHRSHQWDLAGLSRHRDKVRLVTDSNRRRILEQAFHLWAAVDASGLRSLPASFIHGDANDENLLVEDNAVIGLLDIGDSLHNPVVCNLAIALAYAMLSQTEPLPAAGKVVASYHQVRPLSDPELEVLFPLICGRLANTVAVAAKRRTEDAGHPNWFVTEASAWRLLEQLSDTDPTDALGMLASGISDSSTDLAGAPPSALLERRKKHIGPSLSVSYKEPLKMVRGRGQFLFDHRGRPYLDLVNNICHVGHCHPWVVAAGQRQMAELNTNTRYLYDGLTDYAERLCDTLPDPLNVCYFVNSGSEANELALRLARTHTRRLGMLVVDAAYHGNTGRLVNISPYKFLRSGGSGRAEPWVHMVPMADGYRGQYKGQGPGAGIAYGNEVGEVLERADSPVAAFITETIWSCGGQVVPPENYLRTAFDLVRKSGGLCIVDEVQVGFGRVGAAFWGFQLQGVVPDIVVMGKPIGNGHPMGAVVTTPEIAASFDNGMEYFNSFGGNPVSCAIGMAVLDVIEQESLQRHALRLGEHFQNGLTELAGLHDIIGDVRGEGLFIGAELVTDRGSLEPATGAASMIVNEMKKRGVLMSTDGPLDNVLKIKPPLAITEADVDMTLRCLDEVLSEI